MTSRSRGAALTVLLAHAILVQVVSYALRPAISYAILDLGYGPGWLGVATAAFAVPPLVLAIPAGRFVDRVGERTSLVAGGSAFLAASVVAGLAGSTLVGLFAATVLLGLGVLWSVVAEQAWVMRDAPADRLDSTFGVYTFATSSGQMLGPALLLLPSDVGGTPDFDTIAWVLACISGATLLLSMMMRSTTRGQPAAKDRIQQWPAAFRLARTPGVMQALITSSLVLSSLDIMLAYLPLLTVERGLSTSWLTTFLVARGAATMVSRLTLGRATRRCGRRRVLVGAGVLAALALSALILPIPAVGLAACMAVYGFAAGTVQPLTMSWMTLVTPREERGVGASLRLVGNRAGQTGIPLAVAGISVFGGAGLVFAGTGASLLVSAWLSRWAPDDDRRMGRE